MEDAAVTTTLCAGVDADVALRTGQTDRQTHRETERERETHTTGCCYQWNAACTVVARVVDTSTRLRHRASDAAAAAKHLNIAAARHRPVTTARVE